MGGTALLARAIDGPRCPAVPPVVGTEGDVCGWAGGSEGAPRGRLRCLAGDYIVELKSNLAL